MLQRLYAQLLQEQALGGLPPALKPNLPRTDRPQGRGLSRQTSRPSLRSHGTEGWQNWGTGRRALLRFLSRFLDETLHEFEIPDLPDRNAYISFEEWNADCLAHFERLEIRMSAIIARYEAIMDGREPQDVLPAPTGLVIKGPWARSNA